MTIAVPTETTFLYRFEAGSSSYNYTPLAEVQSYNDESYEVVQVEHTPPTFSDEPQQAEIDIAIHEAAGLMDLFINGPPAFPAIVTIFEYDLIAGTATAYYRGWVVRSALELDRSVASLHCKTVMHFFDRESLTDSLGSLSRYSVYDPRSGVDVESLAVAVLVTALNDERDMLTVTGIGDIDGWYTGGIIKAPNGDKRTILKDITESGDRHLYLNAAFPQFTLAAGFNATVYPGDDLTYDTWANKFSSETTNGEAWGGWQYMPNVDPAVRGVF